MPDNEFRYSETSPVVKNKGGRPTDPMAKKFRSVGLIPGDWSFVDLWKIDSDTDEEGKVNYSLVLGRAIEDIRYYLPAGPKVRNRNKSGQWVGSRPVRERGQSKRELKAEIKALRAEVEELKQVAK